MLDLMFSRSEIVVGMSDDSLVPEDFPHHPALDVMIDINLNAKNKFSLYSVPSYTLKRANFPQL